VVAWLDLSDDLGEELPELAVRHVGRSTWTGSASTPTPSG
jgi:hypothetical protein